MQVDQRPLDRSVRSPRPERGGVGSICSPRAGGPPSPPTRRGAHGTRRRCRSGRSSRRRSSSDRGRRATRSGARARSCARGSGTRATGRVPRARVARRNAVVASKSGLGRIGMVTSTTAPGEARTSAVALTVRSLCRLSYPGIDRDDSRARTRPMTFSMRPAAGVLTYAQPYSCFVLPDAGSGVARYGLRNARPGSR